MAWSVFILDLIYYFWEISLTACLSPASTLRIASWFLEGSNAPNTMSSDRDGMILESSSHSLRIWETEFVQIHYCLLIAKKYSRQNQIGSRPWNCHGCVHLRSNLLEKFAFIIELSQELEDKNCKLISRRIETPSTMSSDRDGHEIWYHEPSTHTLGPPPCYCLFRPLKWSVGGKCLRAWTPPPVLMFPFQPDGEVEDPRV